jgi:predicted DNA-binding transcriptional regulator AlpA
VKCVQLHGSRQYERPAKVKTRSQHTPLVNAVIEDDLGDRRLLVKVHEAAHLCGFSTRRAYQLIAARELPAISVAGAWRVSLAHLRAWIDEKMTQGEGSK